jgi:phosphatidylserine decarboxylase
MPGSLLERAFVRAVSNPRLSRCTGWLADRHPPGPLLRALMRAYVRAYGVDLSEVAEPLTAFRTFDEFFVRALKPGTRPIDPDPHAVVSPADARVHSLGLLPADGRLDQIKGHTYALADLLASDTDASRFRAGVHATLYLSPAMYHRVHVPVDGRIVGYRYVPGRLYPVNAVAVRSVAGLFTVNERVIVDIESELFGAVAVVLVGAANVGRITLACAADLRTNSGLSAESVRLLQPQIVRRGDELGRFHLGSTVVLLIADARLVPAPIEAGELMRMGQTLWRRAAP